MTEPHAQRAHARLAPSSASRWIKCPGSIRLSEGLEESPSVFAAEGTAAHELAAHCLLTGFDAERFKGWTVDTAGEQKFHRLKANGVTSFEVDAEMVDGVQVYLDVVREIAEQSEEFECEERMDMSAMVPGCFGTGDAVAYRSEPTRRATIVDLKYGKGVAVDVEDNEQLLTYAMGVAMRYHNRGVDEVELIVVQPRAAHRDGSVRRWVCDIVTLYEHAGALQRAAELAAQDDAPLVPGTWCRFCKAAAICPALYGAAMAVTGAKLIDGEIMSLEAIEKYSPEELAQKMKSLPLVQNWCKRLEEFCHAEAVRGKCPPGFKLVAKRATRKWKDEGVTVETLQMLGVDDDTIFETTVRSPPQLEKSLPAKQRGVIADLAEAKSSGTVLAPLDDSRSAVDVTDARGFEAVTIAERD